jgi:hypothetical protein
MPNTIATKHLRAAHVPRIEPRSLDYNTDVRKQLAPLWNFALTFDGYAYFGGDDDVIGRLGPFADSVQQAWAKNGQIPALGEIGMLRACLFYEQRNWCKCGKEGAPVTPNDASYFAALTEAIRAGLT